MPDLFIFARVSCISYRHIIGFMNGCFCPQVTDAGKQDRPRPCDAGLDLWRRSLEAGAQFINAGDIPDQLIDGFLAFILVLQLL